MSSAVSIGGYAYHIEPKWLKVERVPVKLANLPEAFDGVKIAQISDLHADDILTPEDVAQVVTFVNLLKPDLVVITGDYVTRDSSYGFPIAKALKLLNAPLGCFAVLGNHDYWGRVEEIVEAFDFHSLSLLKNQTQSIERDGSRIWIAGVDDVLERKQDLEKTLAGVPANETIILLAHEPDYADLVAADRRVMLQLSGHSHGGQIRIPFYGAPVLPPLGKKYPWGLNQVGQMQVYTNRGLGVVRWAAVPAMRVNCRPEVTLLTLKRAEL
ncbi:MAG: metallophosphoesterase [Candidatus Poribacteria bacterium]|nr:metallophosphoesterase [Candidatus Poribacteria bacterium]